MKVCVIDGFTKVTMFEILTTLSKQAVMKLYEMWARGFRGVSTFLEFVKKEYPTETFIDLSEVQDVAIVYTT